MLQLCGSAKLAPMLEVISRTAPHWVEILIDVSRAARTASARKQALTERAAGEHSWLIEDADSISIGRLAALLEELRDSAPRESLWRDLGHGEWQEREGVLRRVTGPGGITRPVEACQAQPLFSICHKLADGGTADRH
jgi:hypothetical protein